MKRTALLFALIWIVAEPAQADPYDYRTGWGMFREAAIAHVAAEVKELGNPDASLERRRLEAKQAQVLFDLLRVEWELSPRRGWATITSTGPLPRALSTTPVAPRDFRDRNAFYAALRAEEDAALAEVRKPWWSGDVNRLVERLLIQRELYLTTWQLNTREAWFALDRDRVLRAFAEERRRLLHERAHLGERARVNRRVPSDSKLKLRAAPRSAVTVGYLEPGEWADVIERSGRWVKLRTARAEGWAHSLFLHTETQPAAETQPTATRPTETQPTTETPRGYREMSYGTGGRGGATYRIRRYSRLR